MSVEYDEVPEETLEEYNLLDWYLKALMKISHGPRWVRGTRKFEVDGVKYMANYKLFVRRDRES